MADLTTAAFNDLNNWQMPAKTCRWEHLSKAVVELIHLSASGHWI
jgi:hypothetical protein